MGKQNTATWALALQHLCRVQRRTGEDQSSEILLQAVAHHTTKPKKRGSDLSTNSKFNLKEMYSLWRIFQKQYSNKEYILSFFNLLNCIWKATAAAAAGSAAIGFFQIVLIILGWNCVFLNEVFVPCIIVRSQCGRVVPSGPLIYILYFRNS